MRTLGIDTSNYTTSAAVFDGEGGENAGRLLEVRPGELGLRQSDALFQHVKALPDRFAQLKEGGWLTGIAAVGASTRPRAVTTASIRPVLSRWRSSFSSYPGKPSTLGATRSWSSSRKLLESSSMASRR